MKQVLFCPDYTIRYPRMPNEADPDPTAWKETIARELRTLSDGVFLVGHSVGAAILLDYLASGTEERRLAGVFLPSFLAASISIPPLIFRDVRCGISARDDPSFGRSQPSAGRRPI